MKNNKLEIALAKEACLICCKEVDGPIIINSLLAKGAANNVKQAHGKVIGFAKEPCKECKDMAEKAFLFIGFDEEKSDMENLPIGFYRTGHIIGTKKDIPLVQEFVKKHQPQAIKKGYIFMPHIIMEQFGLINI